MEADAAWDVAVKAVGSVSSSWEDGLTFRIPSKPLNRCIGNLFLLLIYLLPNSKSKRILIGSLILLIFEHHHWSARFMNHQWFAWALQSVKWCVIVGKATIVTEYESLLSYCMFTQLRPTPDRDIPENQDTPWANFPPPYGFSIFTLVLCIP